MAPTLYLCGAGNSEGVRLARIIARRQRRWDDVVVLDDDERRHGQKLLDADIIGPIGCLADVDPAESEVQNLVARTTAGRAAVRARIAAYGIPFASLVHPDVDTDWSELATDLTVYEQGVVSAESIVGEGSVVFMRAIVGHEAHVGAGCVLAAGAVLNARVVLGDRVYVGSNASIVPEVTVGDGATIGANTLVIADVPPGATVIGVPGEIVAMADATTEPSAPVGVQTVVDVELEDRIAAAWSEVLGSNVEHFTDNFFEVGGSSLLAMRVVDRLRRELHCELPVTDMFRFPTVRGLAEHLGGAPGQDRTVGQGRRRAAFRRAMQRNRGIA